MSEEPGSREDAIAAEVEKIYHLLTDAWIRADFPILEKHFHDRILGFEPENPEPIDGKEAVLADYRKFLDAGGRIDYLRSRDIRVRPYGNTALLTYRFETHRTLPGGGAAEFTGKETLLFVRQDGIWKLAHWHYSPDPPATG